SLGQPPAGPACSRARGSVLTGIGFTGASQVTFGGRAATSFTVVNDTTITAVAPPGTGTVDVRVTTPARASDVSAADQYTYLSAVPGLPKAGAGPGR
ncbi:MAG TPA: IPT/TIG domain-containing protein, partial [Candidatus Dormibacteraeota bacterium]|nr:IPT/TIG domain-containing protein [Candidatus Dormibacteraeota bacterium]